MLNDQRLREVASSACLKRRTLRGIHLESLSQVFDGIRIRKAAHSALQIGNTPCAESRMFRQSRLRQFGPLPKLSKKLSKRLPTLLVCHAIEAEHSTVLADFGRVSRS
jgi:hypothetical protein